MNTNSINANINYSKLFSSENPMFEVYTEMATYFNVQPQDRDLKLFVKLKDIITKTGFQTDTLKFLGDRVILFESFLMLESAI